MSIVGKIRTTYLTLSYWLVAVIRETVEWMSSSLENNPSQLSDTSAVRQLDHICVWMHFMTSIMPVSWSYTHTHTHTLLVIDIHHLKLVSYITVNTCIDLSNTDRCHLGSILGQVTTRHYSELCILIVYSWTGLWTRTRCSWVLLWVLVSK